MLKVAEHLTYIVASAIIMMIVVLPSVFELSPESPIGLLVAVSILLSIVSGIFIDFLATHLE